METPKVLGQVVPSATVLTTLYTVPASTSTVLSGIDVCNQNASNIKFRISVAIGGAADTPAQYRFFDVLLIANMTATVMIGATLSAADVVRVQSDTSSVSFNASGVEVQ